MLAVLGRLLLIEAHDAACRQHGRDRGHAQFRGFLQRPIHALAARDALDEGDLQGRLGGAGRGIAEADGDFIAFDAHDFGAEFLAAAIEYTKRCTLAHTQDAGDVVTAGGGQVDFGATGQRAVAKYSVHSHARLIASRGS